MQPSPARPSAPLHVDYCLRLSRLSAVLWVAMWAVCSSAQAQTDKAQARLSAAQQQALRAKLNDTTLLVATSGPTTPHPAMVQDIATMLGSNDSVRLTAVAGTGGMDTLRDLLFLRSMDMAVVPANVLSQAKTAEAPIAGLQQRIVYITPLYSEEVHLLVGRNVRSLQDLRGKRIAVAIGDGNAQFTAGDLLERIGVSMEVVRIAADHAAAAVQSGEVTAALFIGGKPLPSVAVLPKDGSFQLMALPFSRPLEEGYTPAVLRAEDYPALIPPGVIVETVSISAVLVASNLRSSDESYRRVARFVPAFFTGLTDLSAPRLHPKWREVNLGATLSGWTRFQAAQEWLEEARQQQVSALERSFEEFLRTSGVVDPSTLSPTVRKKLFEDFVTWTRKSVAEPNVSARR